MKKIQEVRIEANRLPAQIEVCDFHPLGIIGLYSYYGDSRAKPSQSTVAIFHIKPKIK